MGDQAAAARRDEEGLLQVLWRSRLIVLLFAMFAYSLGESQFRRWWQDQMDGCVFEQEQTFTGGQQQ